MTALSLPETGNWFAQTWLRVTFLLPALALGFGVSLLPRRLLGAGLGFWALGIGLGQYFAGSVLALMAQIPNAENHHYLLFPASVLLLGAGLLPGRRVFVILCLPMSLLIGIGYGSSVALYDPSREGDYLITLLACGLGVWLPLTVALVLRVSGRRWREIGCHIVGSWLVAVGLLYGGFAVFEPLIPVPSQTSREPAPTTPVFPEQEGTGLVDPLAPPMMPGTSSSSARPGFLKDSIDP